MNDYLHRHMGLALSAKDFRTWGGTVKMVECFEIVLREEPDLAPEKVVKCAVKLVAINLSNTPSVCSKYYIHPQVVELFKTDQLVEILCENDAAAAPDDLLSPTERLVLKTLEKSRNSVSVNEAV